MSFLRCGAAGFAAAYAAGEWGEHNRASGLSLRWLYAGLQINVVTMLMLLAAGDLIALFIGWELTSWAGLLLMLPAGGAAIPAARRYIVYAIAEESGPISWLSFEMTKSGKSRDLISKWVPGKNAQEYVVSALIEATKPGSNDTR